MSPFSISFLTTALTLGVGATLFMDAWAWLQKTLLHIPSLNYAFVGRWLGHCTKGTFKHHPIMAATPIPYEKSLGWFAHYAIGVLFAGIHLWVFGLSWFTSPTLWPALTSGLVSVVAPFFILQPCFGFGLAAAKTPKPWVARGRSLLTHAIFGLGLYLTAYFLH